MTNTLSEEQSSRFRAQFARMREKIAEGAVQVGSALVVNYSEDEQKDHQISSFGRMALNEGKYTYYAAPKVVPDNPQVEYKNTFVNLGKLFAKHGTIHTEYVPDDWAKLSYTGNSNFVIDAEIVVKRFFQDEVVIQNPSQTLIELGLQVAQDVKVVIKNEARRKEFKKQPNVVALATHEGDTPVFCGISLPNQDYKKWFAMLPNPYFDHLGVRVSLEETKDKFNLMIQRGGKEYQWYFENGTLSGYGNVFIYPTHQLLPYGMTKAHFLVSNYDMGIATTKAEFLYTSPKFLPPKHVVKERIGDVLAWVDADGFVYDVKELRDTAWMCKGTYYSRRARHPNLKWAPYVEFGRPVSFFSVSLSQKRLLEDEDEPFYYCGRYARHEKVVGKKIEMFASNFAGTEFEKVEAVLSDQGAYQLIGKVPDNYVLYDSEYEWATSNWLLRDQKLNTAVGVLREDHSIYDHPGGRNHTEIANLVTDLEIEDGLARTYPASIGLNDRRFKHSGFIIYKDKWYRPYWSSGVVRTGPQDVHPKSLNCDGLTYSLLFTIIASTLDRRKLFSLGQQTIKVKDILFSLGIASYVRELGVLYVIK